MRRIPWTFYLNKTIIAWDEYIKQYVFEKNENSNEINMKIIIKISKIGTRAIRKNEQNI